MSEVAEAYKAALRHMEQKHRDAADNRNWAFNLCPHDHVVRFESETQTEDRCRTCGARRVLEKP